MFKFMFKSKILGFVEAPVGVFLGSNKFTFEVKMIIGLESTGPDGFGARIGLNVPLD